MPSDRTTVTELGTGLGMLGLADIDEAVRSRTPGDAQPVARDVGAPAARCAPEAPTTPSSTPPGRTGRPSWRPTTACAVGCPRVVEWKGTGRAPGDEVAPIDLRVDHVYLVSCKYLSKILFNVSPSNVFDGLLVGGRTRGGRAAREVLPGGGDWYAEVAPAEYQALYEAVRLAALGWDDRSPAAGRRCTSVAAGRHRRGPPRPALPGLGAADAGRGAGRPGPARHGAPPALLRRLPARAVDLSSPQRDALGRWLGAGWPPGAKALYATLSQAVARASVRRWEAAMEAGTGAGEAMLWRLLRIGSAPYFVLGSSAARSLRLRIATSWDWRRQYKLVSFAIEPQPGGQPRVGWEATVRDRVSHALHAVAGHIEVRWSHGRFGGLPEAKGYLDTPHHLVPGYVTLR